MSSTHSDYDYVLQNGFNPSPETRTALRNQLDLEIVDLRNRLRYLSTVRNALSPIYRLPREILGKIFALVQVGVKGRVSATRILPSSWVSHEWRDVALGYPLLWDHINYANSRWASHSLARSKNAPLFVELPYDAIKHIQQESSYELLFKELPRFRHLYMGELDNRGLDDWVKNAGDNVDVEFQAFQQASDIDDDSSKPVALLETLHVTRHAEDITDTFSKVQLQNLTSLQFRSCLFNWDEFMIPSLKIISIEDPHGSSRVPVTKILTFLSRLPLLEKVTLRSVFSTSDSLEMGHKPMNTPINLSHLTYFKIDARVNDIVQILNHITIPPNASLIISIDPLSGTWVETLGPCIPFIEKRFNSTQVLDTMAMYRSQIGGLSLGFGQREGQSVTTNTTFYLRGVSYRDVYSFEDMRGLFSLLSLTSVKRLRIRGYWPVIAEDNFDALVRFLDVLPNLEDLHLVEAVGVEMLEHLATSPSASLPPWVKSVILSVISYAFRREGQLKPRADMLAALRERSGVKMILQEKFTDPALERWIREKDIFDEVQNEEAKFPFFSW